MHTRTRRSVILGAVLGAMSVAALVVAVAFADDREPAVDDAVAVVVATATAAITPTAATDDPDGKRARASATPDYSKALCQTLAECPPPAASSRFKDKDGYYRIPQWDDRRLSPEAKAQDPWRDPFWPRFVRCMQDVGIGAAIVAPDDATQADIDRLVAEVNAPGPFYFPTPRGLDYRGTRASDAFEPCEVILWEQRPVP